jgi:hypothetical protein
MQSEALAFRCLCCFLRLPSCIGGFAGARCLDWQGPFRVDWCRWCSAVCFCVDKVWMFHWTFLSLPHLHLTWSGPDVASSLQWADLLDVPLFWRLSGQICSEKTWKVGQNLCGLRVKMFRADLEGWSSREDVLSTSVWFCVNYVSTSWRGDWLLTVWITDCFLKWSVASVCYVFILICCELLLLALRLEFTISWITSCLQQFVIVKPL